MCKTLSPEHDTCQATMLGLADKVQLGWDTPWWGDKPLDLNIIFTQKLSGEMVNITDQTKNLHQYNQGFCILM